MPMVALPLSGCFDPIKAWRRWTGANFRQDFFGGGPHGLRRTITVAMHRQQHPVDFALGNRPQHGFADDFHDPGKTIAQVPAFG